MQAASKIKSFLLQSKLNGQLVLKKNCDRFYQIQGQMHIMGCKRCEYEVWTPYRLHKERIECTKMPPFEGATLLLSWQCQMFVGVSQLSFSLKICCKMLKVKSCFSSQSKHYCSRLRTTITPSFYFLIIYRTY